MHLDVGTGDGVYVQRAARRDPGVLVIGVDASADGLRDVGRRLAAKPARGGLANAILGVLPLAQAWADTPDADASAPIVEELAYQCQLIVNVLELIGTPEGGGARQVEVQRHARSGPSESGARHEW